MTDPMQAEREESLEEVLVFLYGSQALDGCWYGSHPVGQPRYWWRSKLRAAVAKQNAELRSLRDALALARSHIGELREALEGLMELERRDRFMPIGREWDAARAALNKEQPLSITEGKESQ